MIPPQQQSSTLNRTSLNQCATPEQPSKLSEIHCKQFASRGISPEFAIKSRCRTVADNEIWQLNFQASLTIDERKKSLHGILFEYSSGGNPVFRLRPDVPPLIDGKPAKYLSRKGDPAKIFLPHTFSTEHKTKTSVNVIITEGEFKALALAESIAPICSRVTSVIGLVGVNGGWTRDRVTKAKPDGTKETIREGAPHLIDDLREWEWKKRTVYLVFDSDVGTEKHASEFKRSSRAGAMGAEFTLAQLLRGQGAEVRIVVIPPGIDGTKYGADDYIVNYGKHQALALIYNNWVVQRDPDVILQRRAANVKIQTARELIDSAPARPLFTLEPLVPKGGLFVIAGGPGIGKSILALNACHAVAVGGRWLNMFQARPGRSLYVQTEMPAWSQSVRIKGMGEVPETLLLWTPEKMTLNFWEHDGYNKKRETGNRELVGAMIDVIKRNQVDLVFFDPFSDLHSLSENDREGMLHVFEVLALIIRATGCSIGLVAHNRKTGGRQGKYEGGDDILGSIVIQAKVDAALSLYSYTRSDETFRYKMVFAKLRHSAPLPPVEIIRYGGESFQWEAQKWEGVETLGERGNSILELLRTEFKDGAKAIDIWRTAKIPEKSFYRKIHELEKSGLVVKKGNLFFANFEGLGENDVTGRCQGDRSDLTGRQSLIDSDI